VKKTVPSWNSSSKEINEEGCGKKNSQHANTKHKQKKRERHESITLLGNFLGKNIGVRESLSND